VPIVETIFELRFASVQPWAARPGVLHAQIRNRYSEQRLLHFAHLTRESAARKPHLHTFRLVP
jgi:hypothetical protein